MYRLNKIGTFIFIISLLLTQVKAQNFKEQFTELFYKKDTVEQQRVLEKWSKSNINDPELYVAYFNYYANKSKKEILTLGQNPQGEALQLMNKDTNNKEPVAYMYSNDYYDRDLLNKGFDWINNGIEKNPNRLDMRFGKIYMLAKIEDYKSFTNEIIKTIDYSNKNKNAWTWSDNKPVETPKDFFLKSLQDYQIQLYNTENDSLLANMKQIAEAVLKYYPTNIESLSNISIVYMVQEKYDKALEVLLKAKKIDEKDGVILGNIAHTYKMKKDNENAIKYYKLVMQYGNDDVKKYAQEQIAELEKSK